MRRCDRSVYSVSKSLTLRQADTDRYVRIAVGKDRMSIPRL